MATESAQLQNPSTLHTTEIIRHLFINYDNEQIQEIRDRINAQINRAVSLSSYQ